MIFKSAMIYPTSSASPPQQDSLYLFLEPDDFIWINQVIKYYPERFKLIRPDLIILDNIHIVNEMMTHSLYIYLAKMFFDALKIECGVKP